MMLTTDMRRALIRSRPGFVERGHPLLIEARVLLHVAKEPGVSMDPEFAQWSEKQKFKHPQTQNEVRFKSLPVEEQAKIRARWQQKRQAPGEGGGDRPDATLPATSNQEGGAAARKKFLETPRDQRPSEWVRVDNGNSLWGHAELSDKAQIENSQIAGDVLDSAKVTRSRVGIGGRVSGEAQVRSSDIDEGAVVEDRAKVSGSGISGRARIRGDSEINNAQIRGGTWDGVKFNGKGGVYHDSYDPKTLDILSGVRTGGSHGPGDGPLRAMAQYLSDGGRTKGWLGGGSLDRKKLTRKIQEHIYDGYDRRDPWLGRGASFIDEFSDDDFAHLMDVAQRKADESQATKRKKKAMLYQLTKTALEKPELRTRLLPLVRLGRDARVASGDVNLREMIIRTAFESTDPHFKAALVRCVVEADRAPVESGAPRRERALRPDERRDLVRAAYESKDPGERHSILERIKQADERHDALIEASSIERDSWEGPFSMEESEIKTLVRVAYTTKDLGRRRVILGLLKEAKYNPGFMKYVEKQQWKHPETGNMVQFVSLPTKEQKKIHEQWKAGKKDWAQQFKPDGLSKDTMLTPEKFDDLKPGDRLWISWAPHVENKVTGFNQTKTGKAVLEYVQVNPETGEEGDVRYMHRSSAGNPKHDIHILPEGAKPKNPKKPEAEKPEAEKPEAEKPEAEKPEAEKPEAEKPEAEKPGIPDAAKESLEIMYANAGSGMNAPGMPGYGASFGGEDGPFSEGTIIEIEEGGYAPIKFQVMSDKLVTGPKGSAMMVKPLPGQSVETTTLIPIGNDYEPKKMYKLEEDKPWGDKTPGKVPLPDPADLPDPAAVMKDSDLSGLLTFLGGDDVKLSDKDAEFGRGTKLRATSSQTGKHQDVMVISDKIVSGSKGDHLLVTGPYGPTLVPLNGKATKLKPLEEKAKEKPKPKKPEEKKAPAPEEAKKTEAPKPTGKHKDRKELVGKGKPGTSEVKMTAGVKDAFVPDGLSEEATKATEAGFKGLTYDGLKQLGANVQAAVDNPEGAYAQALAGSGYKPGDLSKMHKTIKDLLQGADGRAYNQKVLDVANKYDLEGDDADELYDFKGDKPGRGKKLTDQQLFDKFLAKAKPETRDRMQGMNLQDFMIMYKSIMDEEEEEI